MVQGGAEPAKPAKESLIALGWTQGSVLSLEHMRAINPKAHENEWWVVVSHPCDLSCDPAKEPLVEILIGRLDAGAKRKAEDKSGDVALYSSRTIATQIAEGRVVCKAHERFWVDKQTFFGRSPCGNRVLSKDFAEVLARWMAERYSRAAYPDDFNIRMRPLQDWVEKSEENNKAKNKAERKEKNELIYGVFCRMDEERELPDAEPYVVEAVVVVDTDKWNGMKPEKQTEIAKASAAAAKACAGVVFVDKDGEERGFPEIRTANEFTLEDLVVFRRWTRLDQSMEDAGGAVSGV